MPISSSQLEAFIKEDKIQEIFVALGWDYPDPADLISIKAKFASNSYPIAINPLAHKRGFVVCYGKCDEMPPKAVRQKWRTQLARYHYEHLLILSDSHGNQCWIVAIKRPDKPVKHIEVQYTIDQSPNFLLEKLDGMLFSLAEEDTLGIPDVVDRVRTAFDQNAEKVTKAFYQRFRTELNKFQEFITGLTQQIDKEQYAALMLNRLMFIYFIQKNKFLDGDSDYLNNKLKQHRQKNANNNQNPSFYKSFYRHFLLTLFHHGLDAPEEIRSPEVKQRIGKVPYLNGGLFDSHQIEQQYQQDIDIKDDAFEQLFQFFDTYRWYLDDRPTAGGNDINPDVIGYIFEKYINERAKMGAYYTQEDITGYISRHTILPCLLERARKNCRTAFDTEKGTIWQLLKNNPDHYIHDAMRKGGELPDSDLPEHIAIGLDPTAPNLITRRAQWNTAADETWALPTETWREALTRRQHYQALKAKITSGGITTIADLTTHNLNIERLTHDFLQQHEGSDLISAFYTAIAGRQRIEDSNAKEQRGISILDPACGSGAFLFAALNVLQPLYQICIDRMQGFVEEADILNKPRDHWQFRPILDDIKTHNSEKYYIYRTIILNNLFGVDLMPEAAEVAKLRLFLKLAAEAKADPAKPNLGLEPLPDIDFNIRTGNSLVGFTSERDFNDQIGAGQATLDLDGLQQKIHSSVWLVGLAYKRFVQTQTASDINTIEFRKSKNKLRADLAKVNAELNQHLARVYGRDRPGDFDDWQQSHQPFHWFAEFYDIIENNGGFDVVIGNPPYVQYPRKVDYRVQNYKTEKAGDLYALFIERSKQIMHKDAPMGMIIPLPAFATDKKESLMGELMNDSKNLYISHFATSPSKLFEDAQQRLTIFLYLPNRNNSIMSTNYKLWNSEFRPYLINNLSYIETQAIEDIITLPKIGTDIERQVIDKLQQQKALSLSIPKSKLKSKTYYHCYLHDSPRYWTRATDFAPYFYNERDGKKLSTHVRMLSLDDQDNATSLCAVINSTLFFWWFVVISDCRDLNNREIDHFPINLTDFSEKYGQQTKSLVAELMDNYRTHAIRKESQYKATGTVIYDEFHPRHGKLIMDKIDKILADHYGFTEQELDYIINYDYKYRMGGADE